MKEIFDLMRGRIKEESATGFITNGAGFRYLPTVTAEKIINEAEAKWKEKEAELRANVIDEFAEAIIVKATEASEKAIFDGKLLGEALSIDCVSDIVLEIASQMKGEKE